MHEIMSPKPAIGTITWRDLTVPNAQLVRDFYQRVVGWTVREEDLGGYSDYSMMPPGQPDPVAGVCHTRGVNADIPPQWLIYITVGDIDASVAECARLGGKVIVQPRGLAGGRFCVIQDPAGAVCALYQPGSD